MLDTERHLEKLPEEDASHTVSRLKRQLAESNQDHVFVTQVCQ